MKLKQHRHHSFVLRIWWEQGEDDQSTWRGWVQHAATGESRYIHRLVDLLVFIETHTGPLAQESDIEPHKSQGKEKWRMT